MTIIRALSLSVAGALIAVFFAATSTIATAGPFAGVAGTKSATGSGAVSHKVHYRKKYRYHRHTRGKRRYRRNHRSYRRGVVRAPFTRVETGRRVIVDAPFASVYVGRGVRVRAPFVDLWVPRYRRRYYGARYW